MSFSPHIHTHTHKTWIKLFLPIFFIFLSLQSLDVDGRKIEKNYRNFSSKNQSVGLVSETTLEFLTVRKLQLRYSVSRCAVRSWFKILIKASSSSSVELFSGHLKLVMYIDTKMDSLASLKSIKRHYKKDSRYVNDLYTLTYDNHESLENTVELISSLYFRTDIVVVSWEKFMWNRFRNWILWRNRKDFSLVSVKLLPVGSCTSQRNVSSPKSLVV